jgi:hypothetical protein
VKSRLRLIVWLALFASGAVLWIIAASAMDAPRAWIGLLSAFLFFVPLAAGLLTWSASVHASFGEWTGTIERFTLSAIGFSIPSMLLLSMLWAGASYWAPWFGKQAPQGAWYNVNFVFVRDLFALAIFWIIAGIYLKKRGSSRGRFWSGITIVVYCLTITLLSFDLAMGLDPQWGSTAYGAYFFVTGMYAAVAAWGFLSAVSGVDPGKLNDLGKLVFAFAMLSTYLMYAHLLPIWYENMPEETGHLIPFINFTPWSSISIALLIVIYLGPVAYLLPQKVKRSPPLFAAATLLILSGLWVERLWLIQSPLHEKPFTFADFAAAAALLGLLGLSMESALRFLPIESLLRKGGSHD